MKTRLGLFAPPGTLLPPTETLQLLLLPFRSVHEPSVQNYAVLIAASRLRESIYRAYTWTSTTHTSYGRKGDRELQIKSVYVILIHESHGLNDQFRIELQYT